MEGQYNLRSPAVKRLMREAQELAEPTEQYFAHPLENNLFEWHFTIRGPVDSDFDGGIYHGRIILPADYPMKPPSITFLTPNGRFECAVKICLSISKHHPESWQPSWSIRTALLAMIGFMPTPGHGAIGSLDYTSQERKILAKKSVNFVCSECGPVKDKVLPLTSASDQTKEEMMNLAAQLSMQGEKKKDADVHKNTPKTSIPEVSSQPADENTTPNTQVDQILSVGDQAASLDTSSSMSDEQRPQLRHRQAGLQQTGSLETERQSQNIQSPSNEVNQSASGNQRSVVDRLTYFLMIVIAIIIAILLLRRLLKLKYLTAIFDYDDQ